MSAHDIFLPFLATPMPAHRFAVGMQAGGDDAVFGVYPAPSQCVSPGSHEACCTPPASVLAPPLDVDAAITLSAAEDDATARARGAVERTSINSVAPAVGAKNSDYLAAAAAAAAVFHPPVFSTPARDAGANLTLAPSDSDAAPLSLALPWCASSGVRTAGSMYGVCTTSVAPATGSGFLPSHPSSSSPAAASCCCASASAVGVPSLLAHPPAQPHLPPPAALGLPSGGSNSSHLSAMYPTAAATSAAALTCKLSLRAYSMNPQINVSTAASSGASSFASPHAPCSPSAATASASASASALSGSGSVMPTAQQQAHVSDRVVAPAVAACRASLAAASPAAFRRIASAACGVAASGSSFLLPSAKRRANCRTMSLCDAAFCFEEEAMLPDGSPTLASPCSDNSSATPCSNGGAGGSGMDVRQWCAGATPPPRTLRYALEASGHAHRDGAAAAATGVGSGLDSSAAGTSVADEEDDDMSFDDGMPAVGGDWAIPMHFLQRAFAQCTEATGSTPAAAAVVASPSAAYAKRSTNSAPATSQHAGTCTPSKPIAVPARRVATHGGAGKHQATHPLHQHQHRYVPLFM